MKKSIYFLCLFFSSIQLSVAQCDMDVSVSVFEPLCAFTNDGSILLEASNGIAPYFFDNGFISGSSDASFEFTGLSSGTYQITVTDATPCSEIVSVVIDEPIPLQVAISGDFEFCEGEEACVNATVIGGTGGYTFDWGPFSTGPGLCVTVPGTYQLTVTDANGCSVVEFFTIVISNTIPVNITGDLQFCPGGSTTLDAGGGFTTYLWSDGSTSSSLDVLNYGLYSLTVTEGSGCSGVAFVEVTEKQIFPEISGNPIFCIGGSTILDGGAGFASYNWSNGETTQTVEVDASDVYTVTVSDNEGCTGQDLITVLELDEIEPTISGILSFCSGSSTTLNAGAGYESYSWSTGVTTPTIEVDQTGNYSVTVSDASACTGQANVEVLVNPDLQIQISGNPSFCSGSSTVLAVDGFFASYQWSDNSLGQSIFVSTPGLYSVTVTSQDGCTGTSEIVVVESPPLAVNITGGTLLCPGEATILDAGVGYATYLWSNGQNTPTIQVMQAGVYSVTVSDANGCTGVAEITVFVGAIVTEVELTLSTTCTNDGSATALSTGTDPPYLHDWSNGETGNTIDNLSPGDYMVTTTDANGCTIVESFTLPFFTNIVANILSQNITCNGAMDGLIEVTSVIGVEPFTYTWSDGGSGMVRSGLSAGQYNLTITDSDPGSCPYMENFTITEPSEMTAAEVIIPVSCFGTSDGAIEFFNSGGSAPYTFLWSNNSTQQSAFDLSPGTYTVTITDGNNCTLVGGPYVVGESPEIVVDAVITPTTCAGNGNGTIDVTVTGGNGGFNYSWEGPNNFFVNTQNISGLEAGIYLLIIEDMNGCTDTLEYEILASNLMEALITASPSSCISEGNAMVEALGGSGNYSYLWNNGETTASITDLISGTYTVTVTDEDNFCEVVVSTVIDSPIDLQVSSTEVDCDMTNGTATAEVLGGATDPTFLWSNGNTGPIQTGLEPGFYSVTVTDGANDCETHENVEVTLDPFCFVQISGYVYINQTDDCVTSFSSFGAANVMIQLSDGQIAFTDANGYYEFTSETLDAYAITPNYNMVMFESLCTDPITVNAFTYGEHYGDNNFYLEYGPNANRDLKVKVSKPNARPGFVQKVRICLMNVGAVPVTGVLTYIHPEQQEFNQGSPLEDNYDQASRTVIWNFENIPPNTTWFYFAYMYTPIGTALGTPLNYYFKADPVAGDLTPFNNEESCTLPVTGSFDPNDKQVSPLGIGEEGIISMEDTLLSYHIRFQNTGTDTAFTVVVRDELDEDLDPSTVVPGPASHPYTLNIVDGNILEFTFENIMLPDSNINEVESHGFVFFDVQTRTGLEYGTQLDNTAGIYFDFNEPVITNTVSNLIQMIVSTQSPDRTVIPMQLNPNPLSGLGQLNFELEESALIHLDLLDINGRVLKTLMDGTRKNTGSHSLAVDLSGYVNGVYYVRLQTETGDNGVLKVVKLE